MIELSEQAKQIRRERKRAWREKNREKINAYQKEWFNRPENQGKRAEYQANYWENLAKKETVANG